MICLLHAVLCGYGMFVTCRSMWRCYVRYMPHIRGCDVSVKAVLRGIDMSDTYRSMWCHVRPFYVDVLCPLHAVLCGGALYVAGRSTWRCYVSYMPLYVKVLRPLQAVLRGGGVPAAERPGGRHRHVWIDEDHAQGSVIDADRHRGGHDRR